MRLTVHATGRDFLDAAQRSLEEHEASDGLMLAAALRLLAKPADTAFLATVCDADDLLLAAAMTPPHNILVFSPLSPPPGEAIALLCGHLRTGGVHLPGVLGSAELASHFQREWTRVASVASRKAMSQRVYALHRVRREAVTATGRFRLATEADVDLLASWHGEGMRPSLLDLSRTGRIGLWETDAPVSCAAQARRTPRGGAINLVFTPPSLRRRGFATACVASLCQHLLDSGWEFCCLHADLANPTSNSIYRNIGFTPVVDLEEFRFEGVPDAQVHRTP